jgi:hypothetical protein
MRIPTAFKKKLPHPSQVDRLDLGRAKIYLNMFILDELKSETDVVQLVGGLFEASHGDPDVKALLLEKPFDSLPDVDAEAWRAKFEKLWDEFQVTPPIIDGLATLREFCSRHSWWWPESMIIALFDDPSFDAVAYVDFGKSPD